MSDEIDVPECTVQPWVGSSYATGGLDGMRVLLVAEAPESESRPPEPSATRDLVRRHGVGGEPHQAITKIMKAVDGDADRSPDAREEFWNAVAFYHFLQAAAGGEAGASTAEPTWQEAAEPFRSVLDTLVPHAVVVFGKGLWRHVPDGARTLHRELDDGETMTLREYPVPGGEAALAGCVTHPRGGMSYATARPRIETVLGAARSRVEDLSRMDLPLPEAAYPT